MCFGIPILRRDFFFGAMPKKKEEKNGGAEVYIADGYAGRCLPFNLFLELEKPDNVFLRDDPDKS